MRLSELLDLPVLQRLAEANYKASGMPISITDARDGTVLVACGWQDICVLFHRANRQTLERCRESDLNYRPPQGQTAPEQYRCKNGLWDIGVPIWVEDEHLATLFSGQFFYEGEAPDRTFFTQQARQFGFDEAPYLAALDRVPVLSRAVVENILQYNQALAQFISKMAERALTHVRDLEASRDANKRKTEFMAVLSHELRNPLAPIRSSLHVLERVGVTTGQAGRALAVANRQIQHLTRIVDDLLDVTRLSRGKYHLRRQPSDLAEIVRASVEDHRSLFSDSGIALSLQVPSEPVWVRGDAARLMQVMGNLLWNASKFTDPGGHVQVVLQTAEHDVVVRVLDDGIGIARELVDGVFEPFVQADTSLHRTRGGLGLGLALVKSLVELHGGTVKATSAGEGKGSEFIVTLPPSTGPVRVQATPARPTGKRRVLIVEDNKDAADLLRDVLELDGHEVHVSADGSLGVDAALRLQPEVVLCDIGLPGIDGYEVARRLRRSTRCARTLLVAVTGYTSSEDVRRAAEAGFHHHFGKPPDIDKLLHIVAGAPSL